MEKTVAEMFRERARAFRDRPAFKVREGESFNPLTFGEAWERVCDTGTGLIDLGVGRGERVGLISDNRLEWIISDLAIVSVGAADVPRGSDSTPQEIDYILGHSDASAAFVEDARQLEKATALRSRLPDLRFLVVMDPAWTGPAGEGVYSLADVEARGRSLRAGGDRRFEEAMEAVDEDDLATLIYTSGTTGEPKGVMLAHRNLMQNIRVLPGHLQIGETDRFLSILPPWHIFERMVEYVAIAAGASLAYTSIRTFAADMARERPTFIASVPRIWEGVLGKVMAKMEKEPPAKQRIFHFLLRTAKKVMRAQRILTCRDARYEPASPPARAAEWLGALVTVTLRYPLFLFARKKFAAIRARTGGALRAAISGGGALPPYVDEFFAAVGITLLEGYGLTETSPVIAARTFDRQVLGTVGRPIPGTEVRIVDAEGRDLPPGEKGIVKCRGDQVMRGYYKREEETARVLDADGWFDTGDLGRFTRRGELSLTGRAKETIVLLGGENVEPTPLEDALTESPYISQAMVVGQDRKTLGALLVPGFEALRERGGLKGKEPEELVDDPAVRAIIRDETKRLICAGRGFKGFERITRFHLVPREFTIGDELTHTLKKRRNVIMEHFAGEIESLYQ